MSARTAPPRDEAATDEQVQQLVTRTAMRRERRERLERKLLPTLVLVGITIVWELYGRLVGFNPLFFSYPSEIAVALYDYAASNLWADLRVSALEWAVGVSIATSAIPIGMIIGRSRRLVYALDPLINGLYATPTLALTPLFVIWFGLGVESKIAIVAVIAFFPLIITIIEGVSTVDRVLVDAAKSFGARRRDLYRDIVMPGILPFIISGMRLAIRAGVIGVIIGEFIGAINGVGYRIRVFASVFRTAEYLAGIVVLVAISVGLNILLKILERKLAPWRAAMDGR